MNVEIEQKPKGNVLESIKIESPFDVYNIKEVQEIKGAVQEHFIYLGLNRNNMLNNIKLMGIGTSSCINIDSKDIIRTAILNTDERIIIIHNHPSNKLEPSSHDIHLSNVTSKLLQVFNIELLDHIIVTERSYLSMKKAKELDKTYTNDDLNNMDKGFLIEENAQLKKENEELKEKIEEYEEDMEM